MYANPFLSQVRSLSQSNILTQRQGSKLFFSRTRSIFDGETVFALLEEIIKKVLQALHRMANVGVDLYKKTKGGKGIHDEVAALVELQQAMIMSIRTGDDKLSVYPTISTMIGYGNSILTQSKFNAWSARIPGLSASWTYNDVLSKKNEAEKNESESIALTDDVRSELTWLQTNYSTLITLIASLHGSIKQMLMAVFSPL